MGLSSISSSSLHSKPNPKLQSKMSKFWTFITQAHSVAGPIMMLLYPLYASVIAIESPSKEDDEQWLAYWILYSFITLTEILIQPLLEWIPIWYTAKLLFMGWLVLPHFKGAAFIYDRFVRDKVKKYVPAVANRYKSSNGKTM